MVCATCQIVSRGAKAMQLCRECMPKHYIARHAEPLGANPRKRGPKCWHCKVLLDTNPNPCTICGARLCSKRMRPECSARHYSEGHLSVAKGAAQ